MGSNHPASWNFCSYLASLLVSGLTRALLYCCHLFLFSLFSSFSSGNLELTADRVSTLNMNIWLPLFWSTWSPALGPAFKFPWKGQPRGILKAPCMQQWATAPSPASLLSPLSPARLLRLSCQVSPWQLDQNCADKGRRLHPLLSICASREPLGS